MITNGKRTPLLVQVIINMVMRRYLLLFNHSSLRLRLNMENALSPVTSWSTARNFGSLRETKMIQAAGQKYELKSELQSIETHLSRNSSLERVV